MIVDPRDAMREPTPRAAGPSACVRDGRPRKPVAAPTRSSSPKFPYMVQKSRLVERLAELLNEKSCRWYRTSGTSRRKMSRLDHRAARTDRRRRAALMESLFKLTELESRVPLNMNVLINGRVPKVVGLVEALRAWLDHQRDVLVRRAPLPP